MLNMLCGFFFHLLLMGGKTTLRFIGTGLNLGRSWGKTIFFAPTVVKHLSTSSISQSTLLHSTTDNRNSTSKAIIKKSHNRSEPEDMAPFAIVSLLEILASCNLPNTFLNLPLVATNGSTKCHIQTNFTITVTEHIVPTTPTQ